MATVIDSITNAPHGKKLTVVISGAAATAKLVYYNYITETSKNSGTRSTSV